MASAVPGAIQALLGLADQLPGVAEKPSWKGRLREAAYTSPGGTRVIFTYEDVGREVEKRTAVFDFPGVSDAYVQDNGHGSRRYPLRCIFWGDNHDRIATAFEAALLETGVGKLEHPLYGTFNVVPFGTITRRDDLKSAANQTIVEVTFWTTIGAVYPSSQGSPKNEILSALEDFDVASANAFSTATDLEGAAAKANVMATIRKHLTAASKFLQRVADVNAAVNRDFRDFQSTVNLGLDVLIGQPLVLAQQINGLVTAPARALDGIRSRLEAYGDFADSLLESPAGSGDNDAATTSRLRLKAANDFHTTDLFAMSAVSGSALSVVNHRFSTKPEALSAADSVIAQFDTINAWREGRFEGLGQVDTGETYQAMQRAVSLVAGYLVQVSFTVVPERRIALDRPRTIIDLSAELYGRVDDKLDLLIATNNLTGSEILELPRGRVIVYYP